MLSISNIIQENPDITFKWKNQRFVLKFNVQLKIIVSTPQHSENQQIMLSENLYLNKLRYWRQCGSHRWWYFPHQINRRGWSVRLKGWSSKITIFNWHYVKPHKLTVWFKLCTSNVIRSLAFLMVLTAISCDECRISLPSTARILSPTCNTDKLDLSTKWINWGLGKQYSKFGALISRAVWNYCLDENPRYQRVAGNVDLRIKLNYT